MLIQSCPIIDRDWTIEQRIYKPCSIPPASRMKLISAISLFENKFSSGGMVLKQLVILSKAILEFITKLCNIAPTRKRSLKSSAKIYPELVRRP